MYPTHGKSTNKTKLQDNPLRVLTSRTSDSIGTLGGANTNASDSMDEFSKGMLRHELAYGTYGAEAGAGAPHLFSKNPVASEHALAADSFSASSPTHAGSAANAKSGQTAPLSDRRTMLESISSVIDLARFSKSHDTTKEGRGLPLDPWGIKKAAPTFPASPSPSKVAPATVESTTALPRTPKEEREHELKMLSVNKVTDKKTHFEALIAGVSASTKQKKLPPIDDNDYL
jgi:uncharacterized protein YfiM (DUF2279 family)